MMVAIVSGLLLGLLVAVTVGPALWSRKWSAQRDFRRALAGQLKQYRRARFDPQENIAAFRKVLAEQLGRPLGSREIAAVRSVAPELAVFLEFQDGKQIGDALTTLELELDKGHDKWWSTVEKAEKERPRFIERAEALNSDPSNKGECPSCSSIIPILSSACPKCGAQFGPSSAWNVRPLS